RHAARPLAADRVDRRGRSVEHPARRARRLRARERRAVLARGARVRHTAPVARCRVRARRGPLCVSALQRPARSAAAGRRARGLAVSTLDALRIGFVGALSATNLFWAFLGTTLGTAIGVLPGIGPALTVAVLLPVTFGLDPTAAFIMFG